MRVREMPKFSGKLLMLIISVFFLVSVSDGYGFRSEQQLTIIYTSNVYGGLEPCG